MFVPFSILGHLAQAASRERVMEPQMRIGLGQFNQLTEERILFAKQLGLNDVQLQYPPLPG